MSVVALGSVRSCSVTTVATLLAATWPEHRPRLLCELDPAGGTLAAQAGWPADAGLMSLAAAARRSCDPALFFDHCRDLPGGSPVLAGPASAGQAATALDLLAGLLATLGELDVDVVADCGRLGTQTPTAETFGRAHLAVLVVRPRLADLQALAAWLEAADHPSPPGLVLTGPGPYPAGEVAEALGVEVLGEVPWDPVAAGLLATVPVTSRQLSRSPLVRAARSLADEVARRVVPASPPTGSVLPAPVPAATQEVDR
ncbi:MAG: MinD/ParA family ATP-binding protein [Acidimicrobiales bacterium]